jgi:hypothetical protein
MAETEERRREREDLNRMVQARADLEAHRQQGKGCLIALIVSAIYVLIQVSCG